MGSSSFLAPRLIRASAGSGKTYELSSRYIGLLARGEKPERILATTFTRKAAGEIQGRVFNRLAEAVLSETAARNLAEDIELPSFSKRDALSSLRRLIASQHRLNICTLDSFFVSIAKSFALELGLPAQWRISDSHEDEGLVRRAVAALCRRAEIEKTSQLLRLLNSDNLTRFVHRSMVHQAREFYEAFRATGAEAWDWLTAPRGLAPGEIADLLQALRALPLPATKTGTPDKIWAGNHRALLEAVEAEDWNTLVKSKFVLRIIKGDSAFNQRPIPQEFVDVVSRLARHAAALLLGRIAGHNRAAREVLELYDREFREERALSRTLGFSEIKELLAREALGDNLLELYYRLDSSLAHLLLDEFQDTSRQEWIVLEPICGEILSQGSEEQSFFCVGDVKQAIYGWRGGVAEIFDTLQMKWPFLEPVNREISRRCFPAVIEAVNRTFSDLQSNAALKEQSQAAENWQGRFREHSAHNTELAGYVRLEGVSAAQEDEVERPVLQRAALLVKEYSAKWPSLSIGILVRRNETVSRVMEELARVAPGIEASEEGGNSLADSAAVEAVLSLLTLIDHPADKVAHFCVKNSALSEHPGLAGLEDLRRVPLLAANLRKELLSLGLGRFVSGFARMLLAQCGQRDSRRLMQLVELAYGRESETGLRPFDFVEFVRREKIEYALAARVRVMTVHKAKGLEFDAVILPELDENLIQNIQGGLLEYRNRRVEAPVRVSRFAPEGVRVFSEELRLMYEQTATARVEEALSLLYVAMTRARYALYMLIRAVKSEDSAALMYSSLLAEALAGGKRKSGVLFECGSEELSSVEAVRLAEASVRVAEVISVPAGLFPEPGGRRRRSFIRQAPSELEGGALVNLRHTLNLDGAASAARGRIFHRLFEKVEWLEDGKPCRDELEKTLQREQTAVMQTGLILDEFEQMLAATDVYRALSRCSYEHWQTDEIEVQRERRFVARKDSMIINGAFDRLVIGRRAGRITACEVVDFKTDRLPAESADSRKERTEFYRPQLEAYRWAAASITGLPVNRISARIVFVSSGVSVLLNEE